MATAEEKTSSGDRRRRRVLLFPLPFQGHINPMFQLAGVLHSRGFAITIFHTTFNSPDTARHPRYQFVSVDYDGVPGEFATGNDFATIILNMNEKFQARFHAHLGEVLSSSADEDVACLVIDSHWRSMQIAAERLGVPTLVLRTGSAACFGAYMAYPLLCEKGHLPPSDQSQLDIPLTELPPFQLRDMVLSTITRHDMMCNCLDRMVQSVRSSSGVIFNTFDALENAELQKITCELCIPVFSIGPLHKMPLATESSLLAQDLTCLEWLDKQPTASVLYVSFGSLACVDPKGLTEIAWGLANSGQPFLWVIRPNSVHNSQEASLPDGFEEEIRDRGIIGSWAPQQDVLGHCAVGGFWTHNGWNSTLESICEGVPMLCVPQFADQMANARYVEDVWKIGFGLEGELERGKIEKAIGRLMRDREGREMRQRARELKNRAAQCIEKGGSSDTAIDMLVDHILSL